MAQATAITINNGLATPVAVTFSPESVTPSVSVFADRTLGISMLFPRLRVSTSFASKTSKVNRGRLAIEIPVGMTVNGQQSVARIIRANLELILPDGCTDEERKNVFAFVQNSLGNPLVRGALRDLDPLF